MGSNGCFGGVYLAEEVSNELLELERVDLQQIPRGSVAVRCVRGYEIVIYRRWDHSKRLDVTERRRPLCNQSVQRSEAVARIDAGQVELHEASAV